MTNAINNIIIYHKVINRCFPRHFNVSTVARTVFVRVKTGIISQEFSLSTRIPRYCIFEARVVSSGCQGKRKPCEPSHTHHSVTPPRHRRKGVRARGKRASRVYDGGGVAAATSLPPWQKLPVRPPTRRIRKFLSALIKRPLAG